MKQHTVTSNSLSTVRHMMRFCLLELPGRRLDRQTRLRYAADLGERLEVISRVDLLSIEATNLYLSHLAGRGTPAPLKRRKVAAVTAFFHSLRDEGVLSPPAKHSMVRN